MSLLNGADSGLSPQNSRNISRLGNITVESCESASSFSKLLNENVWVCGLSVAFLFVYLFVCLSFLNVGRLYNND